MYAFLLKKHLGFLPNLNIKCVVFNRFNAVFFDPNICLCELPQKIAKYYDRKYFIPFTDIFKNIRDYILVNWNYLMRINALHENVNTFCDTFTIEMKNILNLDKSSKFSSIYDKVNISIKKLNKFELNDRQIENIDKLLLANLFLRDLNESKNKMEILLKFCENFCLNLHLFANLLNSNTLPTLKMLYRISKFCYLFTSRTNSAIRNIEGDLIQRSKEEINRLVKLNLPESEICEKLQIKSHNTLNSIISDLWFEYKINTLRELRSLITYLEVDKDLFMKLHLKGLNFKKIEKYFLEKLIKEDFNAIQIGEILKMDERTARRKISYHFNGMTLEKVKEMCNPIKLQMNQREREVLKKKIKLNMISSNQTKEKLKRELEIGDYRFNTLAKEAFNLDLTPSKIKIYKNLEKIDKEFLSELYKLNLFTIPEIRLFFIEKLLRDGINEKVEICNLLHLSTQQINRLVKSWGESETFGSIRKKVFSQEVPFGEYFIYNVILCKQSEISERDASILNRFQKYNHELFSLLKAKGLSITQMKRRFILQLASEIPNSTTAAEIYGFSDRSSLRYEIHTLWDKNTSFSILKNYVLKSKKKDIKNLKQIESLISNSTIRDLSKLLKISTWKIERLIRENHNGKSFADLKTYLNCKYINASLLHELERNKRGFEDIKIAFVDYLMDKNMKPREISSMLQISIIETKKLLMKL